jgi:phosphate transport system ATP-binding protein
MSASVVEGVSQGRHPEQGRGFRLECERLTVYYGTKCALREVSLAVPEGAITALVGPSGCGKSTFLQALNRLTDLIPGCRVEGSVRLDGVEIHDPAYDPLRLRRRVGMIFQKPNPFPLSIRQNLALPLREHGVRDREDMERILESTLRDVGLWDEVKDRLEASAMGLSGGQQQRLCIARALAIDPEIILFDEPCSALDPLASAVVEDLIVSLGGRYSVLVVTHNLSQARRIAEMTALFWVEGEAGRLIEVGETEQIFDHPKHRLTREYVTGVRG